MGLIYRAILPSGKSYIGQTKRKLEKRIREHINSTDTCYFHNAGKYYGWENVEWIILEECDNNILNEREQYWIDYYDTIYYNGNGYNITPGGDNNAEGSKIFTDNSLFQLVEEFKKCGSVTQLSEKYDCCYNTIYHAIEITDSTVFNKYRQTGIKYTNAQVDEIIKRSSSQTNSEISREMDIPIKFIQDILSGRTRSDYTGISLVTRAERQLCNPVNSKFKKEEILEMVDMFYNQHLDTTFISDKCNINKNRLYEILKGVTWAQITNCTIEQYNNEMTYRNKVTTRLTPDQVLEIVKLYNEGKDKKEIAAQFKISYGLINRILSGERWSSVTHITKNHSNKLKHLTSDQVLEIIALHKQGTSIQEIMDRFQVSRETINRILRGTRWNNITHIKDNKNI